MMNMGKIRILVIDDHEVVRQGLRMYLQADPVMEIIGEAVDGSDAVEKAASLNPDVVIVDLQLPRISGIEAIRQITLQNPKVRVIAYSFYDDESTVLSAFHAGAIGYVLKTSGLDEITEAINNSIRGHRYLGSPLADLTIDALINLRQNGRQDPYSLLTNREKEVLQLVSERNSNSEIAQKLFISRRTVEIHRSHIMRKLGLHRPQVDLIRYAAERGLIKPLYSIADK